MSSLQPSLDGGADVGPVTAITLACFALAWIDRRRQSTPCSAMPLRATHALVGLSALIVLSLIEPATAQSANASCALSEAAAAAGWRLEQIAVVPGEHHAAYAGFATIVTRRRDQSDELWDVWTGARLRQLTPPATDQIQGWLRETSPDAQRAIFEWHGAPATLVDMRTGETLAQIPTFASDDHIPCCAYFSDDSRWLVVSVPDGRREIHNTGTGALQGMFQLAPDADDIALSPDGKRLLAADADTLQLIDTASGAVITSVPSHPTLITRLNARFSSDGTRVVIQNGWQWLLLDAQTGAQLAVGGLPGEEEFYLDFPEFLHNGAYAQFADDAGGRTIVDVRTGRTHISLGRLADEPSQAVEFGIQPSPDGRRFIARAPDGAAALWDVHTGRRLERLGRFAVQSAFEPQPSEEDAIIIGGTIGTTDEFIFTPNGERLVSFDAQGQLSLWNAHTGRRIRVLARSDYIMRRRKDYIRRPEIQVSADSRWVIATTDQDEVTVWSASTGVRIVAITSLGSWVSSVLSDDGRYLAIENGEVRELWDLRARRRIAELGAFDERIYDTAFSLDSAYLLFNRSSDDRTQHILLWGIAEGRVLADLGEFSHVNTYTIAGREIGAVLSGDGYEYALWTLESAQRLLSCSDGQMTLVQQEGRDDVRLLGESGRRDEVIVWRLTPPG